MITLLLFLSIMGPGIITGSVDNDPAGITTYSLAGSQYGYILLWTFIPMTIALAVIQEMGVRMGIVTGKGLASLIREKVGIKLTFFIMFAFLLANFGTTLAEFSGIAVSSDIFGIPRYIGLSLAAFAIWILVMKGNYRRVERIFIFTSFLYISYIIAGILAHPNWTTALSDSFIPISLSLSPAYIAIVVGLVGTTIAPWQMFYIQSTAAEKNIPLKDLNYSRLDAVFGSAVSNFVAYFIVIACAATIFVTGIQVNTVADISQALVPLAGQYASTLFAFGFLNASLFAATILPLSTAFAVCESLGFEAGIHFKFSEAPVFHGLYMGMLILAALIIMIPNVPLLSILFLSQVALGILLPFVLILMLLIINDKKIMGDYVNSKLFNYIAGATVIIIIGLSITLLLINIL